MYAIAVRFQTTVARLQALNGLNGATIYVGQVLKVPA
ncbi:MAG: LysM peptidoglycan-binding domain-containing protein [Candidatus Limnocylindrales bacterium]